MKSILFGNGYWAGIVKEKITDLTDLVMTVNSGIIADIPEADIAFVCCSTTSHYEVIKRCLDKGIKYLYCTKPFTGDYQKAKELFDIAKQKDIHIFVDNLFLFRKEIMNIQLSNIRHLFFYWHKPVIRENFFDSLLYHDLYLLLNWVRSDEWIVNYVYDEEFYLKLENPYQTCRFRYVIGKESKKWISIDNYTIDLSYPENDPLQECIVNMLNGNIDYDMSKKVTLDTLKLMNFIQKQVK